jgi:hypothetical protein
MSSRLVLAVLALSSACTSGTEWVKPGDDPRLQPAPAAQDLPVLEHAEDIADYTFHAKLDPSAHTVHGEGTIRWRNASSVAKDDVWLHLYLNAFKNQKSAFLREPVGAARGALPVRDWGTIDVRKFALHDGEGAGENLWDKAELHRPGDEDETDVHVPLPRAIEPGETVTFDVVFDDKLPSVVERTGYEGSFHFVAQWFPKLARLEEDGTWAHFPFHHLAEFYSDFGTYDVTLDVPEAFRIGATGPVLDSKVEAGRRIERHVQGDIHDFAWTAWDQWQSARETVEGVEVTVLYPPGYEAECQRQLAVIRFALPHFGALYGRYPYSVLTLAHPPDSAGEAGGMEYPTLITTGEDSWFRPSQLHLLELVTLHEFGHQYFYGLLGSDEMSWPFLDEGLNTYAEQESLGAWLGPANVLDLYGLGLSDSTVHTVNGNPAAQDQPVAQPAYAFASGHRYEALVYSRTATILETFRRVYGKEKFDAALGGYTRRFRFRHPRPDDLLTSFAESLGKDAADTLRAALFDKGWVDYSVSTISSHTKAPRAGVYDRDGRRETVSRDGPRGPDYEGWVLITRRGNLSLPVEVELTRADGTTERVPWDGQGDFVRIPYSGSVSLRSAVIDPENRVLLDADRTNNHGALYSTERTFPSRTMERVTYWVELLMGLVSP